MLFYPINRIWTGATNWWWQFFNVRRSVLLLYITWCGSQKCFWARYTNHSSPTTYPPLWPILQLLISYHYSVFRAVNIADHCVAACKLIALTGETTEKDRKTDKKEMRVHLALKHIHVLEFMNAAVVEPKHKQHYIPGIYMLLEFAAGGDLFDKIGSNMLSIMEISTANPGISPRCWRWWQSHSLLLQSIGCWNGKLNMFIRPSFSQPPQGIYTLPRSLPPWSQTWKHPPRRCWDPQDIRLWAICHI